MLPTVKFEISLVLVQGPDIVHGTLLRWPHSYAILASISCLRVLSCFMNELFSDKFGEFEYF